jgi:hypothetical protein
LAEEEDDRLGASIARPRWAEVVELAHVGRLFFFVIFFFFFLFLFLSYYLQI